MSMAITMKWPLPESESGQIWPRAKPGFALGMMAAMPVSIMIWAFVAWLI